MYAPELNLSCGRSLIMSRGGYLIIRAQAQDGAMPTVGLGSADGYVTLKPMKERVISEIKKKSGPQSLRRLKAFFLDLLYISLFSVGLWVFSAYALGFLSILITPIISILYILFFMSYFALFLSSRWAATPGMKFYGLRLSLRSGERLGYKAAFLRTLIFQVVSLFLTPLIHLIVPLTGGKRALHDVLSGTMVVDTATPAP